ncbi:MAG: histidinol dehydrogenase [Desulfobacterales bacterium]|nr:MAG: histidinol dehydrogenase [Desulfobacterales bacterium]
MITPFNSNSDEGRREINALLNRFVSPDDSCRIAVTEILEKVKSNGDQALLAYTNQFDAPFLSDITVSVEELNRAYLQVDDPFMETLEVAIKRIQSFHEREMKDSWLQTRENGTIVGRLVRPVDRAGMYVPGGKGGSTPLVSSVLMNGIPAGIAGVPERVMVTPPSKDGSIDPHLLVAAQEIGIDEIYKAGSAWAIGALAYGTRTIPAVDVIVGPGNQYVAEAKNQVSGLVKIDMIAGPSEVLIVADESANPVHIAADMLAQAEHDPQALAVVITTDPTQPDRILRQLSQQLPHLERAEIARESLTTKGRIIVTDSLEQAIQLANSIAIEHLELQVHDPWHWVPQIRHAGAIFLGNHTPEAAGDYLAGPNHVLPTMGTARYASALGVETFLKESSLISYSATALAEDADHIRMLARLEGLSAHGASITCRLDGK